MLFCAKCTCLRGLESYAKTLHHLPSSPAHKGHLPGIIAKAQQAAAVCEATSLLARVESLMQESEKIAAAAKLEKNWPAANECARACEDGEHLAAGVPHAACLEALSNHAPRAGHSPPPPSQRMKLKSSWKFGTNPTNAPIPSRLPPSNQHRHVPLHYI
jgi:hypothetical protein